MVDAISENAARNLSQMLNERDPDMASNMSKMGAKKQAEGMNYENDLSRS